MAAERSAYQRQLVPKSLRQRDRILQSDSDPDGIRPISDLRNKFTEISDYVQGGNAVIFTKNGHGYMVTMSFDSFKSWCDPVIAELNRADDLCEADERHYTREESLKMLKERAHARRRKLHA